MLQEVLKMAPNKRMRGKVGRNAKDDLKIKVRQLTKAPQSGNDDRAPPDYRFANITTYDE